MRQNGGIPPTGEWPGSIALPPNTGALVRWALVFGGVILLFVALSVFRGIFTDWLWFDNVGFLGVFTTILWTRAWLFIVGAVLFGVMVSINVYLARRNARGASVLPLPEETLRLLDRLMVGGIVLGAAVLSLAFGAIASGKWSQVLMLANGIAFGDSDPVFQKDISFYVFNLPILKTVQGWLMGALVTQLVATLVVYQMHSVVRGLPLKITPWMRGHLAVLGALVFFVIAANHFLDRYQTLFSTSGAVVGATYTQVHARLPALLLLTLIAAASGILLLASLHPALGGPKGNRLIIGAAALWLGAAALAGNVYPTFVQRFTVQPNELEREKPYIDRNIEATRKAFGLDKIEERSYNPAGDVTPEIIASNQDTIYNVRLWDPGPLIDVYNQIQHLRLYYTFKDVDVDRYVVDGRYRQVLIGARELYPENLPEEAQRWVNQRLQYTHGYGAAASPVTEFTGEGRPVFFVQDIPPKGPIAITRPEIYFGENTSNYVIVNSQTEEFNYPTQEDLPARARYEGQGGVQLTSLLRRAAYAWQFADVNILISGQVTPGSRIQYARDIQTRVKKVAPFLALDRDPYLVAEEGRLLWVQDAYTVTDRYPYSRLFDGRFNYIRNSVKVVIDAYQGTMRFYIADTEDPLVRTYAGAFPELFLPMDQMSDFLKAHLRYPEDLFSIQAQTYLQYHMTDANVFFNKEDQWSVPSETSFGKEQPVVPYYIIMRLPGEEKEEFVLILPFTPAQKPNMVAWLAARMDGPHYGKLTAYVFPKGVQTDGTIQIEARISNDTQISQQFTLWDQAGSQVIRGNLLVIPMDDSILYVEPIYLRAEAVPLPELKRVILATSKKVVMEPTLDLALAALMGQAPPTAQPPGTPPSVLPTAVLQLERIQKAFQDLKQGLISLEEAVKQLAQILQEGQK